MVELNPTFQYYEITVGHDTRSIEPVKYLYDLQVKILTIWPDLKNTKLKIKYLDNEGDPCDIDEQNCLDVALNDLRDKQSIHFLVEYQPTP